MTNVAEVRGGSRGAAPGAHGWLAASWLLWGAAAIYTVARGGVLGWLQGGGAFAPALGAELRALLLWALATPLIVHSVRRHPLGGQRWLQSSVFHIGAGVAFIYLLQLFVEVPRVWRGEWAISELLANGVVSWVNHFHLAGIVYGLIVGAAVWLDGRAARPGVALPDAASRDLPASLPGDKIAVRTDDGILVVDGRDVSWIEADGDYAKLHVGGRVLMLRDTLKNLEERLDASRFLRIHRSAIVNLDRSSPAPALSRRLRGHPRRRHRAAPQPHATRSTRDAPRSPAVGQRGPTRRSGVTGGRPMGRVVDFSPRNGLRAATVGAMSRPRLTTPEARSPRPHRRAGSMALLLCLVPLTLADSVAPVAPALAQVLSADDRVDERIELLAARLAGLNDLVHPNLAGFAEQLSLQLDDAAAAAREGLLLAALAGLRQVETSLAGVAFHTAHASEVDTVEEFTALVDELAPALAARADAIVVREDWSGKPAALRALGRSSGARVSGLLEGGRAFGVQAADIIDGLVYFGMAEGAADFAEWLAELPVASGGAAPPFPGLEVQLARLDGAALHAYVEPAARLEGHASFIGVSSALKLAGELMGEGLRESAALAFLEAERSFARLDGDAAGGPLSLDALARLENDLVGRIEVEGVDHSLASLHMEQARRLLLRAREAEGEEASDALGDATLLLREVVPRYFDLLVGETPATAAATAPEVTVTLVRWPFT